MLPLVLTWPGFDPVALHLGPVSIRWYGVMYVLAFLLGYWYIDRRAKRGPFNRVTEPGPWTGDDVTDLIIYAIIGVILGGRLGYCLFYQPKFYAAHPDEILKVWDGGMSFHGGALGVIIALAIYAGRRKRPFLQVTDLLVPAVPIGLGLGRLGNFINGELWGRPASPDLPWAMIFPAVDGQPRHPSQIYELLLEGVVLFCVLHFFSRKRNEPYRGEVSALFLVGYGVLRFLVEFTREPDAFLGKLGLGLSMGQWLCVPMVLAGAIMWVWARKHAYTVPALPVQTDASGASSTTED